MSSVSRINGFTPMKSLTGATWNGQANMYFIPASDGTAVQVGDIVKLAGDARAPLGVPTVARISATSDIPVGVVVGFTFAGVGDTMNVPPVNNLDVPVQRAASTDRYVMVADDPNLIFENQVSGSIATADIGLNVAPVINAGSATGASGMQVDMTTKATTNTLMFELVGFPSRPDNLITDTYVRAFVRFNVHQYKSGTGSVGIS